MKVLHSNKVTECFTSLTSVLNSNYLQTRGQYRDYEKNISYDTFGVKICRLFQPLKLSENSSFSQIKDQKVIISIILIR